MKTKRFLCAGALLIALTTIFANIQAYTVTVHNRTPYKFKIKFDHPASTDNHKEVNANSKFELNTGLKCTRGIEIEEIYDTAAAAYLGVKKENPGGNCDSVTFWITRKKNKADAIEIR